MAELFLNLPIYRNNSQFRRWRVLVRAVAFGLIFSATEFLALAIYFDHRSRVTVDILLFIAGAAALPTLTFAFLPRLKDKCLTIDSTGVHILSGARNVDFLWGDLKRARAEIRSSAGWGVTPGSIDLLTAETPNFVSLFGKSGIPGSESTYVIFEEFGIASVRLASIINAGISKFGSTFSDTRQ